MRKLFVIILFLSLSLSTFANEDKYEKRVQDSMELIKNGKIEEGLTNLLGEGTILYQSVFGTPTTKNNQISQLQNFQNVYGEILGVELVYNKSAGKVTNQWYMIYHKSYPMVLDITFYEIDGEVSVIKYKFEETAEQIPASL